MVSNFAFMKHLRILLSLAIAFAAAAPAKADTNVGVPILTVPVVISKPGKYRLTKALNHTGSSAAITILARDVVIDLNGFAISGTTEADSDNIGIVVNGPNAIIRNGTIRKFNTGIADLAGANGTILENMIFNGQTSTAVRFVALDTLLRGVIVRNIGLQEDEPDEIFGFRMSGSSVIENCLIQNIPFRGGVTQNVAIRLSGGGHVIRETDIHRVEAVAVLTSADIGTIIERLRVRESGTGLSIANSQSAPVVRDSTIRDCITSVSGTFVDGGRNVFD
jgi:hypothetical protein